ncbi:MAG: hypothetical protein CMF72_24520 [Mameliella sp.]|nr:hypothetical protein [Mameliella sp.]|tara:strand:- start:25 stop:192 length:168 start_codon:yes stop_codon:yes gene_type:complete
MGMISTPSTKGTVFETLPVYEALELTEGGDLARIRLADQIYTLRITRAGKLILTK